MDQANIFDDNNLIPLLNNMDFTYKQFKEWHKYNSESNNDNNNENNIISDIQM
jgi:hypothetical protein